MSGINKAIIVGRLGRDPEIRYTPDGTAIANFSVATSDQWKDRDSGDRREKTEWHRIVAFRRLAEICGEYLSKGRQVYIEGKLQTREWEDKDGNRRFTTEIVARDMQMLGGRGDAPPDQGGYDQPGPGSGRSASRDDHGQPSGQPAGDPSPKADVEEDDIPF